MSGCPPNFHNVLHNMQHVLNIICHKDSSNSQWPSGSLNRFLIAPIHQSLVIRLTRMFLLKIDSYLYQLFWFHLYGKETGPLPRNPMSQITSSRGSKYLHLDLRITLSLNIDPRWWIPWSIKSTWITNTKISTHTKIAEQFKWWCPSHFCWYSVLLLNLHISTLAPSTNPMQNGNSY